MENSLSKFVPVADAIAKLFHPNAEVVIHDLENDSIYYITNAFSGREVGDLSNLRVDASGIDFETGVIGPYEKIGPLGQRIRSITSVLRCGNGSPSGILCINLDFSVLESAMFAIEGFLRPPNVEARPEILFRDEWRELIVLEIRAYLREKEQTLENLSVYERKALLEHLDEKRLFYARKSVEQVAMNLGKSRATIYKDLKEIRRRAKKNSNVVFEL